jgi:hypothetical protein
MRGTRGALRLGHVYPYYSPTPEHVSTFNSSTIDQTTAAMSSPYGPVTCCVSLPRQPTRRMLTSSCATCHPSSGDTCHFRIGQTMCQKVQNRMTRVMPRSCHVSCTDMPHHHPYGLPSQHPFFYCLAIQIDRDISLSRHPFEMKQIALGS